MCSLSSPFTYEYLLSGFGSDTAYYLSIDWASHPGSDELAVVRDDNLAYTCIQAGRAMDWDLLIKKPLVQGRQDYLRDNGQMDRSCESYRRVWPHEF